MKYKILFCFIAISFFLNRNVVIAQEGKVYSWNAESNSFFVENQIFCKSSKLDSIGIWKQLGPQNHDILQFDFGDSNADKIYSGSRNHGVYKSIDSGNSWQQINNGIQDFFIRSLAVNPSNTNTILCGTIHKGLYITHDAGNSWNSVLSINDTTVLDITFNSFSGDTVYIGTLNKGLYRSWDGGVNWVHITPNFKNNAMRVFIDPNYSNKIYFASHDTLYHSDDFGDSWESFFTSPYNSTVLSMAIQVGNSNTILIGSHHTLNKSINGGTTWNIIIDTTDIIVNDILIDPNNGDNIYMSCPSMGVYKSVDGGNSWNLLDNGGISINALYVKFHPQLSSVVFTCSNNYGLLRTGYLITSTFEHSINNDFYIKLYPNPVDITATFEYYIPKRFLNKKVYLQIYNNLGNIVKSIVLNSKSLGTNSIVIKLPPFKSGIYYFRGGIETEMQFGKLVKIN